MFIPHFLHKWRTGADELKSITEIRSTLTQNENFTLYLFE